MCCRTIQYPIMSLKRGTNVEFGIHVCLASSPSHVQSVVMHYAKKYGLTQGNKGVVVRAKNGWYRVSWTRSDGVRVPSVPMRAEHLRVISVPKCVDDTALQAKLDEAGYARLPCDMSVDTPQFKKAKIEPFADKISEQLAGFEERIAKLELEMSRMRMS